MRVTVPRLVGAKGQLRPRKSIWQSALTRRRKWRARWRSNRAVGGQGRIAVRRSTSAWSHAAWGLWPGGAADRGIWVGHPAIQDDLSGGVIGDLFVGQQRDPALLQGAQAALAFAFGLRTRGDRMGHAQGGEGALELGTGIPIVGHGIMAKEAEAVGVDDQRQVGLQKAAAKTREMIPGRIGGDKDRAQKFSPMIGAGQRQGLPGGGWPPLVEGGIMLPEFAAAGAFPAAAAFGAWFRLADEVGEMGSDKGGDRLPVAFETEAAGQFIGRQLKGGRFLQWDKIVAEPAGLRGPIWPVAAAGQLGGKRRTLLEPARA
jgi:hypothetical protein